MSKKIVIIGATSAIAHYCARYWAGAGTNQLVLVGRDAGRVGRTKSDLSVHGPEAIIDTRICDFLDPAAITALVDDVVVGGVPDIVLIAHGVLPEQSVCEKDLTACKEALEINGISPVLFAEAFAQHFATAGKGTLARHQFGCRGSRA
jgi:decaprenylphospho-beta-D-erythro-pentofuranosid-2-ulose 2-reductase